MWRYCNYIILVCGALVYEYLKFGSTYPINLILHHFSERIPSLATRVAPFLHVTRPRVSDNPIKNEREENLGERGRSHVYVLVSCIDNMMGCQTYHILYIKSFQLDLYQIGRRLVNVNLGTLCTLRGLKHLLGCHQTYCILYIHSNFIHSFQFDRYQIGRRLIYTNSCLGTPLRTLMGSNHLTWEDRPIAFRPSPCNLLTLI